MLVEIELLVSDFSGKISKTIEHIGQYPNQEIDFDIPLDGVGKKIISGCNVSSLGVTTFYSFSDLQVNVVAPIGNTEHGETPRTTKNEGEGGRGWR